MEVTYGPAQLHITILAVSKQRSRKQAIADLQVVIREVKNRENALDPEIDRVDRSSRSCVFEVESAD